VDPTTTVGIDGGVGTVVAVGLPTRLVTVELELEHRGGVVQDVVVALVCERTELPAARPRLRVPVPDGDAPGILTRSIEVAVAAIEDWAGHNDVRFVDDPFRVTSIALRRGLGSPRRFVGRAG